MLRRIRSELQSLQGLSQNCNVWKDMDIIAMFGRMEKEMQCLKGKIRSEFECLEGLGQNSNVWKDMDIIAMFGRMEKEMQCLKG